MVSGSLALLYFYFENTFSWFACLSIHPFFRSPHLAIQPEAWLVGPQIWLAEPQIWLAGPQAWLAC